MARIGLARRVIRALAFLAVIVLLLLAVKSMVGSGGGSAETDPEVDVDIYTPAKKRPTRLQASNEDDHTGVDHDSHGGVSGSDKPKETEEKDQKTVMPKPEPPLSKDLFKSQEGQDRWLYENVFKHTGAAGFFVEFGARNGQSHSNTYFFEKSMKWWGLLAEASPREQKDIATVRDQAAVLDGAICPEEKVVSFMELGDIGWGGILDSYDEQRLKDRANEMHKIDAQCYRLDKTLDFFGVKAIDYMSVDTEGSELDALLSFPFDRIPVRVVGIEVLIGGGRDGRIQETIDYMRQRRYRLLRKHEVAHDTLDLFFEPDYNVDKSFKQARFSIKRFVEARSECQAKQVKGKPMCLSPK